MNSVKFCDSAQRGPQREFAAQVSFANLLNCDDIDGRDAAHLRTDSRRRESFLLWPIGHTCCPDQLGSAQAEFGAKSAVGVRPIPPADAWTSRCPLRDRCSFRNRLLPSVIIGSNERPTLRFIDE